MQKTAKSKIVKYDLDWLTIVDNRCDSQSKYVLRYVKILQYEYWLVVSTPLKNMKVNWDDYFQYNQYMEKYKSCSSHHQPEYETQALIIITWGLNVLCWLWVPPHLWAPTAWRLPPKAIARRPVVWMAPEEWHEAMEIISVVVESGIGTCDTWITMDSLDWFKAKSTGNHGVTPKNMGLSCRCSPIHPSKEISNENSHILPNS